MFYISLRTKERRFDLFPGTITIGNDRILLILDQLKTNNIFGSYPAVPGATSCPHPPTCHYSDYVQGEQLTAEEILHEMFTNLPTVEYN